MNESHGSVNQQQRHVVIKTGTGTLESACEPLALAILNAVHVNELEVPYTSTSTSTSTRNTFNNTNNNNNENSKLFLTNVCLCAIVKNEKENFANGIVEYCHRILPYVKYAVIVDTGSTDQTYEILQDLAETTYKHLYVVQGAFRVFAE